MSAAIRRHAAASLLGALLLAGAAARASAQGGYLVQGVADAELWKTDSASSLLARNGGRPAALGRLTVWGAVEPLRNLILFADLYGEAGPARHEPGSEVYVNQLGVRYTPSDAFTIEAGKVRHVVGLFATRRLSVRNPLIGAPDGYSEVYPVGVVASGTVGRVDYRAGMLSLPLTREDYVPESGADYRPALGLGFTPVMGVRLGVTASAGSYLNPEIAAASLAGREWCDYDQRIVAAELQVSHGYFEGNAEAARSSYDVPGTEPVDGWSGYVEGKLTLSPRVYLAARVQRNDYPYIAERGDGGWIAVRSAFTEAEIAGGYRFGPSTLGKLALRRDRWTPSPNPGAPQANGYALVTQLSQAFDVVELLRRRP